MIGLGEYQLILYKEKQSMKTGIKKVLACVLALGMLAGCSAKTETYTGTGKGFGGDITVTITVDSNGKITAVESTGEKETEAIGGAALATLDANLLEAQSAEFDGVAGATLTSNGYKEAAAAAIAQSKGEEENLEISFKPGTYTGKGKGYNGEVVADVTFTESGIESIEVTQTAETAHVGDVAYDIMVPEIIEYTSTGVDGVSGATFTSNALKAAVEDAAQQAGCNVKALQKGAKAYEVTAGEDQDVTYDVVIVGAGGAGMGAAAQAVQNGNSVLVIEENAEIGGNTLVSGGQYQSVMPYLVWDAKNPDATEATWDYNGKTYTKIKASQGQLGVLKTILNWSEEPFDPSYFDTHEYVAGEIDELSKAGVHEEYLDTLKALKSEIKAYVDWADAKIAKGAKESDLTLFSTVNLHIFQTYYGGLRQSADGKTWIYGDYDLVSQFIKDGQGLKEWLEDQGALFADDKQLTLIGALWYRENQNMGCDMDGDGVPEISGGNWGTYFVPLKTTVESVEGNEIMTRTKAEKLIVEDGKVTGVEATKYDGTKVTAHATKGVILATGGYAANIEMVVKENTYWDSDYVTTGIKTTNRSSLQGDGIVMAQEAGADVTGMGFPQMMPISWIDNGNLAFGGGQYAVYINPTTGKRFVDESAERDVLSLGEFANGVEVNGTKGVFLEITNANQAIGIPYPYDKYEKGQVVEISKDDVENRVYYVSSAEEMQKVLDKFGMTAKPEDIYATIKQYDEAYLNDKAPADGIKKSAATTTIGTVTKDGEYKLEGELLRIRVMAPSTHHTMGGVVVDTERHVLDTKGNVIDGLYAAGEVTGGIHGGNRLGGNAIVEILVSGRIAADTIAGK